jgi:type IV secretion system protein TrbL
MNKQMLLIATILIALSTDALAAIDGPNIMDDVQGRFAAAAAGWADAITARATWLFWVLALISMVWTHGFLLLRKADIGEFYAEFLRFTITTGFFWWLLSNGPAMATGIFASMQTLGSNAAGLGVVTPSGIIDAGFQVFGKAITASSIWEPVEGAALIIMGAVVLIIMALIATNMLVLYVSGWILAYAGVIYLGFGGGRWTTDLAIGFYKTVLNVAIQLMAMILIVGIGQAFINDYVAAMEADMTYADMGSFLVASVVLLLLVNKVPPMLGQVAFGGGTGALGHGFGAGSAMAAAATAGAAIGVAGGAIAAGATNIGGGIQAIMAASNKAAEFAGSGGGSDSALRMTADYLQGGQSNSDSASSKTTTPLGEAMGGSSTSSRDSDSKYGPSMIKNLATGIGEVAKQKIKDRTSNTFGGQVASAISNSGQPTPSFGGDSLSGSDETVDPAEEVAAFTNGNNSGNAQSA